MLERAEPVQRQKRKAEVWRLSGTTADVRVFAKRCRRHEADREELVYTGVLPRTGMGTARYLGRADAGDGRTAWVFVEEVVGAVYDARVPWHRDLAADWLSALHAAARACPAPDGLPDVGPRRYRAMLDDLVHLLPAAAGNPELGPDDLEVLERTADCCHELSDLWPRLVLAVEEFPRTLVHGSFSQRNMLIATRHGRPVLHVFDWGAAGWGVPARDLGKLVEAKIAGPESRYWRRFPEVARADRALLLAAGRLFRAIEHLGWVAPRLSRSWVEEPMRTATAHADRLVATSAVLRRLLS
ncbi:phosphotransferase family protein [Geodermatophilus sp. SYSU D00684]